MRSRFNRAYLGTVLALGAGACASGAADSQTTPYTPPVTGAGGAVVSTLPGNTVPAGTVPQQTTVPGVGGAGGVAVAMGGAVAVGGATAAKGGTTAVATTSCTPPTPVATWKSPTACAATQAAIDTLYATWHTNYFKDCGTTAYILKDDESPNVTVSEGIAYGMLISATLGKTTDFGKLAQFYLGHLNGNGVMSWKLSASCSPSVVDQGAATDADLDAALAFIIADKAGMGGGAYLTNAKTLIGNIKKSMLAACAPGTLVKPGDGWGGCSQLNPSYFSPGHYRAFAKVTGDTSWTSVASAAYTLLAKYQANFSGKVYDWANDSGGAIQNPNANAQFKAPAVFYGFEACRMPWRIALDYGWNQTAEAKTFLTAMNEKLIVPAGGYPGVVSANPGVSGWTADNEKNSCFVGGYALVGTAVDQATTDKYVKDWLNRNLTGDNGAGAYYKLTLKLLYLITAGGKFPSGL